VVQLSVAATTLQLMIPEVASPTAESPEERSVGSLVQEWEDNDLVLLWQDPMTLKTGKAVPMAAFVATYCQLMEGVEDAWRQRLLKLFRRFDTDNSGTLTLKEFRALMCTLSDDAGIQTPPGFSQEVRQLFEIGLEQAAAERVIQSAAGADNNSTADNDRTAEAHVVQATTEGGTTFTIRELDGESFINGCGQNISELLSKATLMQLQRGLNGLSMGADSDGAVRTRLDPKKNAKLLMLLSDGVLQKFDEFDVSGDKNIDVTELLPLLRSMQHPSVMGSPGPDQEAAALEIVLKRLDSDGSGSISAVEYVAWWREDGVRSVFARHDVDRGGSLGGDELSNFLIELGMNDEAMRQEAVVAMDPNGDGEVDWVEVVGYLDALDARMQFDKYDEDGGGSISLAELSALCFAMGLALQAEHLAVAMQMLDADRNGSLSFEEFLKWWLVERQKQMSSSARPASAGGL
jgi:Ca2+-binding EF-hand superfamily protein